VRRWPWAVAVGYEDEKRRASWKEFEAGPCWKLVSDPTSGQSFATLVGVEAHIVQGCRRLVVGSPAGGIVEDQVACTAFEDTCRERPA
jgi:hypothetical protein